MITDIIQKWEENKSKLEEYFKNTEQKEYSEYKTIVKKIFELVVNTSIDRDDNFDINGMTVIDDGDYQGTQIFIVHKDTYQPSVGDYVVTDTYYGSCSGCDTLQAISDYDDGRPSESQLKEYMALALHLVQKMRWLSGAEED